MKTKLSRTDLIREVTQRIYGHTRMQESHFVASVLDTTVDVIKETIANKMNVVWTGFLTLKVDERAPHRAYNLNEGKVVMYPSKKTLKCVFPKEMRELIKDGEDKPQ